MRATRITTAQDSVTRTREVFADPVAYLGNLGIDAELITVVNSEHTPALPAAA